MHRPETHATFVIGKGWPRRRGEERRAGERGVAVLSSLSVETNIVGSDFCDLQRASLSWHLSRCDDSGCGCGMDRREG